MARTKQTARLKATKATVARPPPPPPPPPPPVAPITIINSSDQSVGESANNNNYVILHAKNEENCSVYFASNTIKIGEHASTVVPLPATSFDGEHIKSWALAVCSGDLIWNENDSWRIPVVPGGTYHLAPEPQAGPPMDNEQYEAVTLALLRTLQSDVRFEDIWDVIAHKQLSETVLAGRTTTRLMRTFTAFDHNVRRRIPYWQNLYQSVQVRPKALDVDLNKAVTTGGSAVIDLYWRALDRFPGGNADIHTVCFTFDCTTRTVCSRVVHNWEGTLTKRIYTPKNLSIRVAEEHGAFPEFLTTLRALGFGSSECTILDSMSEDSEEYDTTWSSQEVLVSVPRPWSPSSHQKTFGS